MTLKLFVILVFCLHIARGANILFFFALSTYSHRIAVWPLVEELAERGHKITFVQPFKPKKPNLNVTEFYPSDVAEKIEQGLGSFDFLNVRLTRGLHAVSELAKQLPGKGLSTCQGFLLHEESRNWIKKSKFDLVVIDELMNECGFGLAYKFRAKTILFGTTHPYAWIYDAVGMIQETSWIAESHNPYDFPMSLWERLTSTMWPLILYYNKVFNYYPELDKLCQDVFEDPGIPPVSELESRVHLILQNTHFSEEVARALPPLVIPVGGMYCGDASQKLSKELEDFINASGVDGFVYVSFGSAANVAKAPKEFQKIFHDVMRESKLRFVWKYDGQRPADLPDSVFTQSWLPQQAILAHPKIKGFVTHGGLLGIHEAIWNAVPLVVMPVFAEQDYNAIRIQRTQRGIMLDVNTLSKDKFANALEKITKDPKYKANMEMTLKLFKDRPETPVKTAVWWTEYVLRNDEASLAFLKPLGVHQTWYERRLLDVWGIVFVAVAACFGLMFLIVVEMYRAACSGSKIEDRRDRTQRSYKKSN